jgi:hypothetical protein
MSPLPLPVRVAAGLVVTAVEQARELPRLMVEFPVTAVSQALQASMRVQQRVTDLAIKGDRALGVLRPAEDQPSWATFDDEDIVENGAPATVNNAVVEPEPEPNGPNVMPEYGSLTIPQLRGRLRHLSVDDLHALLAWETSHDNRPPFVTMLSNRITTVTEA